MYTRLPASWPRNMSRSARWRAFNSAPFPVDPRCCASSSMSAGPQIQPSDVLAARLRRGSASVRKAFCTVRGLRWVAATIFAILSGPGLCTSTAYTRAGLTPSPPARVYAVLVQSPGPLSMAKIVAATHLKPRTVQKALRTLADPRRNLAAKTSDGWICGPADIDELAQHRGSTGKGAELKARHRAERLMFRGHEAGSRVYIVKAAPQRKQCTGTTQAL